MLGSYTFEGTYIPRSSEPGKDGPIGEKELLENNPKRIELLKKVTGWSDFQKGSLNLLVAASVVKILGHLRELYFEDASLIRYPKDETNIAEMRGGYLYYNGEMISSDDNQGILVRRAKEKPLAYIVEVYAEVMLKEKFRLNRNDPVMVRVWDAD